MRLKLIMFGLLFSVGLFIWGCQKELSNKNEALTETELAKEWWYGNFRKSAEYSNVDYNSPLSPDKNFSPKKYPNWPEAVTYSKNSFIITEVPLYFITNKVLMPEMKHLPEAEASKIARSVIHKLVILKDQKGFSNVRIATVIPSPEYARKANYDISDIHPNSLPKDFDGYLSIASWGLSLKNFVKIKSGRPEKTITIKRTVKPPKTSSNNMLDILVCPPPNEVPIMVWVCVVIPSGDQVADDEDCQSNGHWVQNGTDWEYPDCYDDEDPYGGGGGTLENCLQNNSNPEQCYCLLWGVNCDNEGGGGDDPPPPDDPCAEAQTNINKTNLLSQSSSYANAKNSIQNANPGVEHSITFGIDNNGDINSSSMTSCSNPSSCNVNANWPGAFADLHNHPGSLPPSPGDLYGLITINHSNNNYDTRMVITSNGSVFALVVINSNLANTFKNNYPSIDLGFGPDFPTEIFDKFQEVKDVFMLQGISSIVAEERAMAYVLDKYDTGMALLKQNANGSFNRLKTDESASNGNVTYIANNCL